MKKTIITTMLALIAMMGWAQKRVNNHLYNPDPAPVVSGDRLYVFTGHDLDTATYFRMPDWQLFSTTDMEHWTDHGVVLTTANFKWAKQGDNAWASQAIERNGKWYWYVAAEDTTKHLHGIGHNLYQRRNEIRHCCYFVSSTYSQMKRFSWRNSNNMLCLRNMNSSK